MDLQVLLEVNEKESMPMLFLDGIITTCIPKQGKERNDFKNCGGGGCLPFST